MSTIFSKPRINFIEQRDTIEETKEPNDFDLQESELSPEIISQDSNIIISHRSTNLDNEPIITKIKKIRHEYESGLLINNLEKKDMLIEYEDFELYDKRANPIFVRNLLNMINVINRIWLSVEKNVEIFHKILKDYFNTKFSYLEDEYTDFALAMPLQKSALMKVYEMKEPFPDLTDKSKHLNNFYLDLEKIKSYTLQEMSISAILAKTNANDFVVFPNTIFYIKQNSVVNKLRKIFQNPKAIKLQNNQRENNFLGFNELDYVVKVKSNDILIEPTNMMNHVRIGNSNNYLDEKILFDKNTIHFFEFKTKGNNIDKEINDLTIKSKRFMKIYETNPSNFDFLEIATDNYKCHYIYNDNRNSIAEKLPFINEKDASVIYSSPGNEISLIVTIQTKMENEISELKTEINELKTEISKLNSKFNNFEKNLSNLFKDSINPKSTFSKHYKNMSKTIINFKSLLSENEKLEKDFITFKSFSQEKPGSWIDFFNGIFKQYLSQIDSLDNKLNQFFLSKKNCNELLIIKDILGKSQFKNNEDKKLKNLFTNLEVENFKDMLYLSMKYVFFQVNNENLLDCFSDKEDIKIHEMIIRIFKYIKYQKDNDIEESELIIIQLAVLRQVTDIAQINEDYSELCSNLLSINKISFKQFIIGCILLINGENDNDMELIKNFLKYNDY